MVEHDPAGLALAVVVMHQIVQLPVIGSPRSPLIRLPSAQ